MEKIIKIDGRDVRFVSSAALPLRYKMQFGRDMFADMAALDGAQDDVSKLDTETFYNLVWTLAKCADPSIPPLLEWLDKFDEFPIFEIFGELQDLIIRAFKPTKN